MASGLLQGKENNRWARFSKVYSRKIFKGVRVNVIVGEDNRVSNRIGDKPESGRGCGDILAVDGSVKDGGLVGLETVSDGSGTDCRSDKRCGFVGADVGRVDGVDEENDRYKSSRDGENLSSLETVSEDSRTDCGSDAQCDLGSVNGFVGTDVALVDGIDEENDQYKSSRDGKNLSSLETVSEESLSFNRSEALVSDGFESKSGSGFDGTVVTKTDDCNRNNHEGNEIGDVDVKENDQHKNSSTVEIVSEDSLSFDRTEAPVSDGYESKSGNGFDGTVVTKEDDCNQSNHEANEIGDVDGKENDQHKNSSTVEIVLEDSLSFDRSEAPVSDGYESKSGNGFDGTVVTKEDDCNRNNHGVNEIGDADGKENDQHKNSSPVEIVSEDSSSFDRSEAPVSDGYESKSGNGFDGTVVTKVDDCNVINLVADEIDDINDKENDQHKSSRHEKNSSPLETVSQDSLSFNRSEAPVSIGFESKSENGFDGAVVTQVDDCNLNNHVANEIEDVNDKENDQHTSSRYEKNLSPLETVSEDSLTVNRSEAPVLNECESKSVSGFGGTVVNQVDDCNENNHVANEIGDVNEMENDQPKSSQHEKNSSPLETVSEDSLTFNRSEAPVSNGCESKSANGFDETVVTQVDDCNKNNHVLNGIHDVNDKENDQHNSTRPGKNLSPLETVSEDSSTFNQSEAPVSNGYESKLGNGFVGPVVTQVDDRVRISVSGASSKEKIRELKRKLESQLHEVRKMAKRLKAKEIQLSEYTDGEVDLDTGGHVGVSNVHVGGSLQYFKGNGGLEKGLSGSVRVNSEMSSVGYSDSRPFRNLSVCVTDNNHGISETFENDKRTPKANHYYRNSEFILGRDKVPLAGSNKKSKSAGGRKYGGREVDYSFGIYKQIFNNCSNLLQKIMKHKHGWVFNQPVDVKGLGLHDYFDLIKHPMDLGTVKTRLTKNWYKTPREFAEDVRLTFHNAMTYNPEGQDVYIMARDLLRIFEGKWSSIEIDYDRKLKYAMMHDLGAPTPTSRKTYAPMHDIGAPTPTSRKTYAPAHVFAPVPVTPPPLLHQPPPFQDARQLERSQSMPVPPDSRSKPVHSGGRTPALKKPKAKDLHKRDMTFEEKQRLSINLQCLPPEKLDDLVLLIKKRNSALSQHDGEIEVDIDSVDAETLWELDRFVTNHKKSLSKQKRKAEVALQARETAAKVVQETIPAPANIEETTQDERNVVTSPSRVQQQERHSGSGTSSSSSSSSDSGSSSSDSDSDSSSS